MQGYVKPCPFCGCSTCELVQVDPITWMIQCPLCEGHGPLKDNQQEARLSWNKRHYALEDKREHITIYNDLKSHGICTKCGRHPAAPGKTLCLDCADQAAVYAMSLRERRKREGLCADCGKRPPRPGRYTCEACNQQRLLANARRRERRKAAGLCVHCGKRPPFKEVSENLCGICFARLKEIKARTR